MARHPRRRSRGLRARLEDLARSAAVLAALTLGVAGAAEPVVEILGVDRIDADQDARAEALDVRLVLQGTAHGTVVVRGLLLADGVPVSDRPSRAHALPTQAMLGVGPGPQTLVLRFSGEQIRASALDGPYDLLLDLPGAQPIVLPRITAALEHTRFGERSAELGAITPWRDGPSLAVDAEILVHAPGTYVLQGGLVTAGATVNAADTRQLPAGPATLQVRFPVSAWNPGPYDALLTLVHVGRGGQDQRPLRIDLDPGAPRESARD